MSMIDGGYIFLSHSHEDIPVVRKVRNYLEDIGGNPIMLYLRGTDKPSVIKSIIKREIKARENFIFCDSPYSRKSKWVEWEREYVNKLKKRPRTMTVDITQDFDSVVKPQLKQFKKITTAFISCRASEQILWLAVAEKLRSIDINVLSTDDIQVGADYVCEITSMIKKACDEGIVILLITDETFKSPIVTSEIHFAIFQGGLVLPIIVGDLHQDLPDFLSSTQFLRIHSTPTSKDLDEIINKVYEISMNSIT